MHDARESRGRPSTGYARGVIRLLVLPLVVVTLGATAAAGATAADGPYRSSVRPLPAKLRAQLQGESWRPGCPVPLSGLRVLTVRHWGFDGRSHTGQLVVNGNHASGLARVFGKLYDLRFPIRCSRKSKAKIRSREHSRRAPTSLPPAVTSSPPNATIDFWRSRGPICQDRC